VRILQNKINERSVFSRHEKYRKPVYPFKGGERCLQWLRHRFQFTLVVLVLGFLLNDFEIIYLKHSLLKAIFSPPHPSQKDSTSGFSTASRFHFKQQCRGNMRSVLNHCCDVTRSQTQKDRPKYKKLIHVIISASPHKQPQIFQNSPPVLFELKQSVRSWFQSISKRARWNFIHHQSWAAATLEIAVIPLRVGRAHEIFSRTLVVLWLLKFYFMPTSNKF